MINIHLPSGRYVLAVSGGVDSVVLLDVLTHQKNLELIVAHFDHGIREDSKEDRIFVERLAKKYGLPFESAEGKLGKHASEQTARDSRYKFLRSVLAKHKALAIITAHHQDDVLETMLINLIRGTKRKGLSSLKNQPDIQRPLLNVSKKELIQYAQDHNIMWHEDSTNSDTNYLRNWVRKYLIQKLTSDQRQQLLDSNVKLQDINQEVDQLLRSEFDTSDDQIAKKTVLSLPHDVAKEVVADWLRQNGIADFDRPTIERLVIGAKTLRSGKSVEIKHGYKMQITIDSLKITK
jgi:tRNA(Ile)-lysidine synthase